MKVGLTALVIAVLGMSGSAQGATVKQPSDRVADQFASATFWLALGLNQDPPQAMIVNTGIIHRCPHVGGGYRCSFTIRFRIDRTDPMQKCELPVWAWPRGYRYNRGSCPRDVLPNRS
jgi:hypothetical protein